MLMELQRKIQELKEKVGRENTERKIFWKDLKAEWLRCKRPLME